MAHIGFTPQAEHAIGGYRVQGRGDAGAQRPARRRARPAGRRRLRRRPRDGARRRSPAQITKTLEIPTIGIGAGPDCDGQVLVWQDMMGLRTGKAPRFVKRYADLHSVMLGAARAYAGDVKAGEFPGPEHASRPDGATPGALVIGPM